MDSGDVSGDDDGLDDIYQLLCPLSLPLDTDSNNNNVKPPDQPQDKDHITGQTAASNKQKDLRSTPSSSSRRGRPRVSPLTEKIIRERRDAANARERKRMNQMTRAYSRLKEKLPNHENINSKKQIVDQVRSMLRQKALTSTHCFRP